MKNFYFTFGTNPQFPYGLNQFVIAEAVNKNMAMRMFKAKYPGPNEELVNCAFCYTEEEFDKFRNEHYSGVKPSDIIRVNTHEDIAALEIVDRLEWFADGLMGICKGLDSTEKAEALALQEAADEIKRLRKEVAAR